MYWYLTRKLKLIYKTVYNYIQTIEEITNVLVPYKEVKTYLYNSL